MLCWFQPRFSNPEIQRRGCWFSSSGIPDTLSYVYLRVMVSLKGISKIRMLKGNCLEVAQRKTEKTVYPNLSSTTSLGFTQVSSEVCFLQAENSGWVVANSIFFSQQTLQISCFQHTFSTFPSDESIFLPYWQHLYALVLHSSRESTQCLST